MFFSLLSPYEVSVNVHDSLKYEMKRDDSAANMQEYINLKRHLIVDDEIKVMHVTEIERSPGDGCVDIPTRVGQSRKALP